MFFTGPAAVRLYDDHVDAVHRYVTRRLGRELGTPLVGETFALAVNSEGPPNNTSEMERSWLLSIANGLLRRHDEDERRRLAAWTDEERRTADPLLPHAAPPGPSGPSEVSQVMRAAAKLQPDDRDLLFLTVWEGYSQQTVARIMGLSTGAASSALKRVRRELRKGASGTDHAPVDARDDPTEADGSAADRPVGDGAARNGKKGTG